MIVQIHHWYSNQKWCVEVTDEQEVWQYLYQRTGWNVTPVPVMPLAEMLDDAYRKGLLKEKPTNLFAGENCGKMLAEEDNDQPDQN